MTDNVTPISPDTEHMLSLEARVDELVSEVVNKTADYEELMRRYNSVIGVLFYVHGLLMSDKIGSESWLAMRDEADELFAEMYGSELDI